jgi:hypothetical protein
MKIRLTEHETGLVNLLNHQIFNLIPNIQVVAKEVDFCDGRRTVCEPDGLVWANNKLYIIEYKLSSKHREEAKLQLLKARYFVRDVLGLKNIDIEQMVVYRDKIDPTERDK